MFACPLRTPRRRGAEMKAANGALPGGRKSDEAKGVLLLFFLMFLTFFFFFKLFRLFLFF